MFGLWTSGKEAAVSQAAYYGLFALQHRGQQAAGIAVTDGKIVDYHKGKGLLSDVFAVNTLPSGVGALAHVLYTGGQVRTANAQPFVVRYKYGTIAVAANGRLTNADKLREELAADGAVFSTGVDAELMALLIAKANGCGLEGSVKYMAERLEGAYSVAILTNKGLIAARDPYGLRPLAIGRTDDGGYVVASESCAFDAVGAVFERDVQPGEIVMINSDGLRSVSVRPAQKSALCVFEFVYFARVDSAIDGLSVYEARFQAGRRLARVLPVEADLVCGVPDSALAAAIGYAEESGIAYGDGLAKNRYVGRTFIQPDQSQRVRSVHMKLNALQSNVKGKRVVLVDDSIVRGTTSANLVEMLRAAGAKEVHMRISSPIVRFGCPYGIDTYEPSQLIANRMSEDAFRKQIGADSLAFLGLEALREACGAANLCFCEGCFDGKYPTEL